MTDYKLTAEDIAPFCEGFSKEQMQQALNICQEYQLTPLKRQIHFSLRNKKVSEGVYKKEMTYLVTVDGLRGIAERSDKYQGQVGPFWCGSDGQWSDVWLKPGYPLAAKVGVNKAGFREPLFAVAKYEEYAQKGKDGKPMQMWAKMPDLMIAKCAEALALRRAFPDETSGLYTVEEMDQAENPKPTSPHNDINPSVFSMSGDPDPENPFASSEDRKKWMLDAKDSLDAVDDDEGLKKWASTFGQNIKWLGNTQQKAMNELFASKQAEIGNREFDRKATA